MDENYMIAEFQEKITALADTPNVSAGELKRRLQAPAEELRVAHNALAEDHAALTGRVDGIVARSFEGEITREMLAEEVRGEIEGKADGSIVAQLAALETAVGGKCEVVFGTYDGDNSTDRVISLGFTPKAVILASSDGRMTYSSGGLYCFGGLFTPTSPLQRSGVTAAQIVEDGFQVTYLYNESYRAYTNSTGQGYIFIAVK